MDRSREQNRTGRGARWVALLLLCASAAVLISLATMQSRSKDFMSYYAAGTLARRSPAQLYSLPRQQQLQTPLTDLHNFLPWVHPAAEALLFAPLSRLPYKTAFAIWAVINTCLFAFIMYLLRRRFQAIGDTGTYAVAAACGLPILAGFWGGQDHLLTLLLVVLGFLRAEKNRDLQAGFWLGLALIRFQITLPLLLFFAVLRRWRVLAGAVVGAAALLGLSFALVGAQLLPKYWAALRFLGGMHDTGTTTYMPTIRGFIACVAGEPRHAGAITISISCAVLLIAVVLWSRQTVPFAQLFASAVLIALAVDYHGFMYEWSLLLLAGVFILERRPELRWVFLALGGAEILILLTHTGLFGLLAPVPVVLGLWMARAGRQRTQSLQMATS